MTNLRTAEQEYYIQGLIEEGTHKLIRRVEMQKGVAPVPKRGG